MQRRGNSASLITYRNRRVGYQTRQKHSGKITVTTSSNLLSYSVQHDLLLQQGPAGSGPAVRQRQERNGGLTLPLTVSFAWKKGIVESMRDPVSCITI